MGVFVATCCITTKTIINDYVVMAVLLAKCCITTKSINKDYVVMGVFVAKCCITAKPINKDYVVMDVFVAKSPPLPLWKVSRPENVGLLHMLYATTHIIEDATSAHATS
jgi:hypothetical protein